MIDSKMYVAWVSYAVLGVVLITWRAQVVAFLKRWEISEILLAGSETVFTGAAGFCAAWFKVWDPTSWDSPTHTRHSLFALAALLISAFLAFFSKWVRDRVKERDKERIASLESELVAVQAKLLGARESLANWRRLGTQIRGLVDRKIDRVRRALRGGRPTIDDLLVPQDRETQINTILQSIHGFFYFDLQQRSPQAKMRLGLYLPHDNATRLDLFYSWDGNKTDCFRKGSPAFMMINSPQGVLAEIVKTYHRNGDCQLSLIPDCKAAEAHGFTFFHPRQAEHLKSMLAFKYIFELDGTPAALILSLDCNEAGFFDTSRQEEIGEFLVEMLRRFEYEMLGLEIVSSLNSAHPPPQPAANHIQP